MAEYKIKLGVELDTSDLISQINAAESKVDPIKIKVDAETKELTKSIQDALKTLSKGGKNTLTLDTFRFEGSIADIKSAVLDLKKTLGTLDDSANMKSLLSSVNQIANAIGKVTDESETLAKSLSVLSKKDFGFNFNLKTGNANPLKAATDYGIEARRKAIPAMKEQVAYLQDMLGGTEKAEKALERYLIKQSKGFGGVTEKNKLQREMLGGTDLDGKTISYNKQMGALEQMVDYYKKIAVESGNSLDGFNAKFSQTAESIVDDTVKIQTGVKQTEEAIEAAANEMKQMFGGGIGAEQLSAQLKPIVVDLNQIREAVQSLSSGVSLEGLTDSFDRLSSAIKNLLTNAERVKGILNSGFDNSIVDTAAPSTPSSAVKSAQQTGHQIGETVKQSVKQSLTLDDVIDEQVQNLMNRYGIKGKKAFNEIKQAVVEYRKELQLANNVDIKPDINDPFGLYDDDFGNYADIRKVMSAITDNVGRVRNPDREKLEETYGAIWDEMRGTKNSGKITIPIEYKYEFPDDFRNMVRHLPKRFSTKPGGTDFDSWFAGLDDNLKEMIVHYQGNVSENIRDHFKNASDIWNLRDSEPAFLRGDDILKHDDFNPEKMMGEIDSVIDNINQKEQELSQSSNQSADTIAQNQNKIRQEYEQTKQEIARTEEAIREFENRINNPESTDFDSASKEIEGYQMAIDNLEQHKAELESKASSLQAQLDAEAQQAQETANIVVQAEERKQQAKKATSSLSKEADKINKKLIGSDLGASKYDNEIDNVTTKFDKLSNQSDQLKSDMQSLNVAFGNIKAASAANDVESLVSANREYEQVLTRVKNQIDINSRAQKEADAIAKKEASERAKAEKEAAAIASKMQKEADAAAVKETNTELKKLKDLSHQIGQLDFKIVKSDYNDEINQIREFERQLELLKRQYTETVQSLSAKGINIGDIATPEFVEARNKIAEFEAQIKDMRVELAKDIKLNIELGNYDNEISGMYEKFNRLSGASKELRGSVEQVKNAYREMELAIQGTGDEVADRERLIQAEKEYSAALEKTNNLIRIQAREDSKMNAADKLADKKKALQLDMANYLKDNSRAAKEFGDEIRRLSALLDNVNLDSIGTNQVERTFKNLKREIKGAGKEGLSTFDSLKAKIKEYSTYFSAAELFMYAEQALRSMFEQVKLIDSAMTELKKVTNESDASYNQFLSRAASRSKVLGTTIDGLVSSTADFARLGYSFEDSQGLAEVANIYAVVGDEIEGVEGATESLISTMAAFKDSAKGMSNSDFAMSIIDKFNEIGKLIA